MLAHSRKQLKGMEETKNRAEEDAFRAREQIVVAQLKFSLPVPCLSLE